MRSQQQSLPRSKNKAPEISPSAQHAAAGTAEVAAYIPSLSQASQQTSADSSLPANG
jgi:hypothetical protein